MPTLPPGGNRLVQTASRIVTTEAVLWGWLNALSHQSVREIAAEGYRRIRAGDTANRTVPGRADKNWSRMDCLSLVARIAPVREDGRQAPLRVVLACSIPAPDVY
jgi:hypothetical protein